MDQQFRKKVGASAVYKHLHGKNNKKCLKLSLHYNDSFDIIDQARTRFGLKLKEALHIKWDEPDLNKQVGHEMINRAV